jgi:hypothetical protein
MPDDVRHEPQAERIARRGAVREHHAPSGRCTRRASVCVTTPESSKPHSAGAKRASSAATTRSQEERHFHPAPDGESVTAVSVAARSATASPVALGPTAGPTGDGLLDPAETPRRRRAAAARPARAARVVVDRAEDGKRSSHPHVVGVQTLRPVERHGRHGLASRTAAARTASPVPRDASRDDGESRPERATASARVRIEARRRRGGLPAVVRAAVPTPRWRRRQRAPPRAPRGVRRPRARGARGALAPTPSSVDRRDRRIEPGGGGPAPASARGDQPRRAGGVSRRYTSPRQYTKAGLVTTVSPRRAISRTQAGGHSPRCSRR